MTARVEDLQREVHELRRRLLALAAVLPEEYLPLLEIPTDHIALAMVPRRMWEGWEETTQLIPSDVEGELARLWRRLTPT